jgi:DNA-binding Lrp family transcriptional regulator
MADPKTGADDAELLVLSHIRKNARKSVAGISAETEMPASTVLSRLRHLESGVVKKYTTLLDFQKLGYNVLIHLALKAADTERNSLGSFLMSHPNVNSVFRAGAGYDYYAETVFSDLKGLYDFLDELSAYDIEKIDEHHIIEEIKKEEFMSRVEPSSMIQYPRHMMVF